MECTIVASTVGGAALIGFVISELLPLQSVVPANSITQAIFYLLRSIRVKAPATETPPPV